MVLKYLFGVEGESPQADATGTRIIENADSSGCRISVIITAHNSAGSLRRTFESLRTQCGAGDWELVLVADRCSDDTASLEADFSDLAPRILQYNDVSGSVQTTRQAALALGASQATGQILLFTDADAQLPPDWIAGIRVRLRRCHVFCGPVFHRSRSWFWSGYLSLDAALNLLLYRLLHGLGLKSGGFGPNLAVHRGVYLAVGGYCDQHFSLSEDRQLINLLEDQGARVCHGRGPTVTVDSADSLRAILCRGRRILPGELGALALIYVVGGLSWLALLVGGLSFGGDWWLAFLIRVGFGQLILASAVLWAGKPSLLIWDLLYEPLAILISVAVLVSVRLDPVIYWGGRPYRH